MNKDALRGAVIGGTIAVVIPVFLLVYSSVTYQGGGANIGEGLLFLSMPVYLPLAIWLGWILGKKRSRL